MFPAFRTACRKVPCTCCKMAVSPNINKKRKDIKKSVTSAIKHDTKLKSKVKSKKMVQSTKTSKLSQAAKDSKGAKENQVTKAITRSLIKKDKKEGETQSSASVQKVTKPVQERKTKTPLDTNSIARRILKRKQRSVDENSSQSTLKRQQNTHSLKVQKRRKLEVQSNEQDSDNSYLKDLSRDHILQCITAIFHLTQEQLKNKSALFDGESHPIFLQVTCIRIPKTPKRQIRILLPQSILSVNDEVAMFVCDMERGRRKDYEPTKEHYENLLNEHGCKAVKSIIPMNQVKTEYDQYELKRKLLSSYDHFLVDGRIAGHISHLLGKEFYRKRKLPISVRMDSKDLKHEIEHALKKTNMHLHSNGDTHTVQIGHTEMKEENVLENIIATCGYLSQNYPGGWDNIRSISIKTATSLSLPVYMTLKNKNTVKVPEITARRPKAYNVVQGELSTVSGNTKVTVTPEGDVLVKRKARSYKKMGRRGKKSTQGSVI